MLRTRLLNLPQGRVFTASAGRPDAPALVCLHGLLTTAHSFRYVLESAERLGLHVVAIDFPGAGDSDRPAPERYDYSLESLADTVCQVVDELGFVDVSFLGHDLGGTVLLHLLANGLRERVRKAVLVAPGCYPFPLPLPGRLALLPGIGELALRGLARAPLRRFLRSGYVAPTALDEQAIDVYWDRLARTGGLRAAHAMLKNFERLHRLVHVFPRIEAEVMVLWGDADTIIDVGHGVSLVSDLARARLTSVEGAGHYPHEERPAAVIDLIAEFLALVNESPAHGAR